MRICQIIPGNIPIPNKFWGSVEKIIWNYKKGLENLGHQVDIKHIEDVKSGEYDVLHCHMAHKAHAAMDKELKYVFSLHDHHVFLDNYLSLKDYNLEAIQNSEVTLAPSHKFVDLFQSDKVQYLSHGVDTSFFRNTQKNKNVSRHKLLCVGNNGLQGDCTNDRKGFRLSIEVAKELNLPITVVGPRNCNEAFFEANKDLLEYDKINLAYDVDDDELLKLYNQHTIFLHLSNLEGGHPNLTLLEALACGLPVVATYEDIEKLYGLKVVERTKESVISGINDVIENYDNYRRLARIDSKKFSWTNVVKELETVYFRVSGKVEVKNSMKEAFERAYSNLQKRESNINPNLKNTIVVSFLDGAKVEVLGKKEEKYHIDFIDNSSNSLIYTTDITTNHWASPNPKYYVDWRIFVNNREIKMDLTNQEVLISLESKSLGDSIAWMHPILEFKEKHNCNVTTTTFWNHIFQPAYPELKFLPPGVSLNPYFAWWRIGCYDENVNHNKEHWRHIPLQKVATDILGLEFKEQRPRILRSKESKPIEGKYVTISEHSTLKAKYWNYEGGWQEIIDYLHGIGYNVMVVSKENTSLKRIINRTGKTIEETIRNIQYADFHITTGSGTAWLSWALETPVIMISGFSNPQSEFQDCYRVFNDQVCNSCYNDIAYKFDRGDWHWCPRYKNYECSQEITPEMVIEKISECINDFKR